MIKSDCNQNADTTTEAAVEKMEKNPLFEARDSDFTVALRDSTATRSVYSLMIVLHILYGLYVRLVWQTQPDVYSQDAAFMQRIFSKVHVFVIYEVGMSAGIVLFTILAARMRSKSVIVIQFLFTLAFPFFMMRRFQMHELMCGFVTS